MGGQISGDAYSSDVEIYDPMTDRWSVRGRLSLARWGLAVAAIGDRLYAVTGQTSTDDYSDAMEEMRTLYLHSKD